MWFDSIHTSVILASASPRRKELLASVGIDFTVQPAQIDEKALASELLSQRPFSPENYVTQLALAKGENISQLNPGSLIISADTVVVLQNEILEKPADIPEACAMLKRLQGEQHTVWTAIAVFYKGEHLVKALNTSVWMRPLTSTQIQDYVATGEPMDKAGAYAIQGLGSILVEKIDGCYTNVVGLSLPMLYNLVSQVVVTSAQSCG